MILFIVGTTHFNPVMAYSMYYRYSINNNYSMQTLVNNQTATPPKPYLKTNSYSQRASLQQVLTLALFLALVVLQCVFMARPIVAIDHPVLYILWAIYWLLLLMIAVEYILLTRSDPVDRLVPEPEAVAEMILRGEEYYRKTGQAYKQVVDEQGID